MATSYNTPFMQKPDAGFRLGDIRAIYDAIVNANAHSAAYGIAAAGTTQATATQLTSVINAVDTVASSTGVNLPLSTGARTTPFQMCYIMNNGANTMKVYAAQGSSDTINGTAGATGISQPAGVNSVYVSAQGGKWEVFGSGDNADFGAVTVTSLNSSGVITGTTVAATSITNSGNFTETTAGSGFIQKTAAGTARAGSFSLNGATAVTVTNTTVAVTDFIGLSLNTVGGTVGVQPHVTTISAGVYFTVIGTAGDTSLYNYSMIGVN